MQATTFKAFAIGSEIDLNQIAVHCGIRKKYTWEEPLVLKDGILASILGPDADETRQVLVFSFGSIVFVNHQTQGMTDFLRFIHSFEPQIDMENAGRFTDDYSLHAGATDRIELTDEYAAVPEHEIFYPELISTVLAKSVALERIEEQLGRINDKLETLLVRLEKGKLRVGNKELARTTAHIMRHEYNSLSYVMILDKPDVTWTNSQAGQFYDRLMEFFELNDRYEILKKKTEVLYHIMEGFSTISHSMRGLFVEWIIVILIVVEVGLTVLQIAGVLP